MKFLAFVTLVGLTFCINAEQVVLEAGANASGTGLQPENAVQGTVDSQAVISPPINADDYLERHGLKLQIPDGFGKDAAEFYAVIEHLDAGLGFIQVFYTIGAEKGAPGRRAAAEGVAGYTCLGTKSPRRALFRISRADFAAHPEIEIVGVSAIRRVVLKTALADGEQAAIEAERPRNVAPQVKLARPMQWVMSVGATARDPQAVNEALTIMREFCPLASALGFNGAESYVKWNLVETKQGEFDWSYYDTIVDEAASHGLKFFPLLIVGSAYTLPQWYYDSPLNEGFACLEHGKSNNIQTIFCENQTPYVKAFLNEFGKHYGPSGKLLGVRLGPSGNFGESQYPAGGNWGYAGRTEHIHIGWWAGDKYAAPHFQNWLEKKYGALDKLNAAWNAQFGQWGEVKCFIPQFAETPRERKDLTDWYMWAMSDWCERWAIWAREAMPDTPIYQSAGGWGFVESGTDFTDQTASMVKVKGGIRATNETDSYSQNFQVTRMMSSAARFYGVPFGSEPAGFNSA
jgi:hypothetical protein